MTETALNGFRTALASGRPQLGVWNSLVCPTVTEILSRSAADWVVIDTEHSPADIGDVIHALRAAVGGNAHPVVRPKWNDPVEIKRLLDVGARNLLVPFIQTVEDGQNAVAATRYPPRGIRGVAGGHRASGYGRNADYFKTADDSICLLVQIETRQAVNVVDQIAAIDGVHGVFAGPSDLAASYGHIGVPSQPEVEDAIRRVLEAATAAGKPAGILAPTPEKATQYARMGFRFVAMATDIALLRNATDTLCQTVQGSLDTDRTS